MPFKPHNSRNKFSVSSKEDRTVDGILFASKKEATRWSQLKLLERAGKIRDLKRQPKWDVTINGVKVCSYLADFWYIETVDGKGVVEDVKGMKTPLYKLKKKLVEAQYGFSITEV